MVTILPRTDWSSKPLPGFSRLLVAAQVTEIVCHYPGTDQRWHDVSKTLVAARLEAIRRYHTSSRGWADIGYCWGIDPAGRVWELAGNRVAAHSATKTRPLQNHTSIGVLMMLHPDEPMTPEMIAAFIELRKWLAGTYPLRRVICHNDVPGANTSCAGKYVHAWHSGTIEPPAPPKPGPGPAPAPKPKPAVWPYALLPATIQHTAASHAAWVKLMADVGYTDKSLTLAMQRWLKKLGYYGGKLDGQFGPWTVDALQRFLRAKGLYKGALDGLTQPYRIARGPLMIAAEIAYLNQQAATYENGARQ